MVFLGIVLHDFQDPLVVLKNAKVMLKPDGKLVNLDWRRIHQEFGPPYEIRFSEERATSLIEEAGFEVENVAGEGPFHYLITARPKTCK